MKIEGRTGRGEETRGGGEGKKEESRGKMKGGKEKQINRWSKR